MDNPEKMKCIWNIKFTNFVEMLNSRQGISLNPNFSFNLNYGVYLNEIKRLIALIPGVYASEKATEIWQQYIANVCQVQEDKKAAKKEYEENLQNEGKATANKKQENEVRKIKKDYDKKQHKLLVISLATGAFSGSLAYFLTFLYPKTCIFMAVLYIFQGS